jgi:hypothetical protein
MPPKHSAVNSATLTDSIDEMGRRLDAMAEARHKANESLNGIILKFTEQNEEFHDRISLVESTLNQGINKLATAVQALASDTRDLKFRLIGDSALQSEGLVQQHGLTAKRLTDVETLANKNQDHLKALKRERVIVFSVLGTIGAVVAWIKSVALFKWLSGQ